MAEGPYVGAPTFDLNNGVEIYAGFESNPGAEGNFGIRYFESFVTIISGDTDGDDITSNGIVTDPDNIIADNSLCKWSEEMGI